MCSVSDMSMYSVLVLFGSILMDCSLQQRNDPLQRKEMSYMRETDSFRAGHCSYLPLEGLGKVKSSLPILCRHIETIHFQQDRGRSAYLPHSLRAGWHPSPVAHSPAPQTHSMPPAEGGREGGGHIHVYEAKRLIMKFIQFYKG